MNAFLSSFAVVSAVMGMAYTVLTIIFIAKGLSFMKETKVYHTAMVARQEAIISLLLGARDASGNIDFEKVDQYLQQGQFEAGASESGFQRVACGIDENLIVRHYKLIKKQYGSSLSEKGIVLKLEKELGIGSETIEAALAKRIKK